eukprot:Nitzschia sp. Nitz4//scaffold299_size22801//20930//21568//NITZ4_008540-RA/size22801-processed-gene-0.54-mRNA-1//-1//CDS//3329546357//4929//frame0
MVFSLLRRHKAAPEPKRASVTKSKEAADNDSAQWATPNMPVKRGSARFGKLPSPEGSEVPRSVIMQNLNAVMDLIEAMNKQDYQKLLEVTSDDYIVEFEQQELIRSDFFEELEKVWKSFPDFSIEGEYYEVRPDGVIVAHKFVPKGTHTGAPYGCGPYDAIPASGKKVVNAPETVYFYCRDGKVCRHIVIYNEGDMSGPAGFYTQLGGFPLL